MNQWSFGVQRQLSRSTGLDVQYLGSHSLHLDRSYFNNTPYFPGPGRHQSAASQSIVRPDPHHLQRSDFELSPPGGLGAPAAVPRLPVRRQLHVVARARRHQRLQQRRRSDESLQLAPGLRQRSVRYPASLRGDLYLLDSVRRDQQSGPEGRVRRLADQRDYHHAERHAVQPVDEHRCRQHQLAGLRSVPIC